jgi:hypothetical protein
MAKDPTLAMDGWSSASLQAALIPDRAAHQAMERTLTAANLQTALATVNPPPTPPTPPATSTGASTSPDGSALSK